MRKIQDIGVENKKVIFRVGLDVSIENGHAKEKFKIKAVKKAADYLMKKGAKVAIMTYLGRPDGKKDMNFSLEQIKSDVEEILEYKMSFDFVSIKTLFWYLLGSFNIPEEFKKQIVNHLLLFNPKFFSEYWASVFKTFISGFLVFLLAILIPIIQIFRKHLKANFRIIAFSIFWFLTGISPVLFLPNHYFVMYLILPSVGIYFLMAYLLSSFGKKIFIIPTLIIWFFSSYNTISFYKINSYQIEAQKFARTFYTEIKNEFPNLPKNSIVYYPLESSQKQLALENQEAIKAIYNDSSLSIYYNKEDLLSSLKKGNTGKVYIYFPK